MSVHEGPPRNLTPDATEPENSRKRPPLIPPHMVAGVLGKDHATWEAWVPEVTPRLKGIARKTVTRLPDETADVIVQETLAKLVASSDIHDPNAWLYRVTYTTAVGIMTRGNNAHELHNIPLSKLTDGDYRQQKKAERLLTSPPPTSEASPMMKHVTTVMHYAPSNDKTLFQLKLRGVKSKEIAQKLSVSEETIRVRSLDLYNRLRESLDNPHDAMIIMTKAPAPEFTARHQKEVAVDELMEYAPADDQILLQMRDEKIRDKRIAPAFGLKPSGVRKRAQRIKKRLREAQQHPENAAQIMATKTTMQRLYAKFTPEALDALMQHAPPDDQKIFQMKRAGCKNKEIAAEFGTTENAVKKLLQKLYGRLDRAKENPEKAAAIMTKKAKKKESVEHVVYERTTTA